MSVKENIRKIIEADPDLSVRGVSLKAGMSDSALHKFLTSDTQSISVNNLQEVAKVIGVDVRDLFGGDIKTTSRQATPIASYSVPTTEQLVPLLNALLPLLPTLPATEQSVRALSAALAHGLALLGDLPSNETEDAALRVASRGAVIRFQETTVQ